MNRRTRVAEVSPWDSLSRRQMMEWTAKSALGVSLMPAVFPASSLAAPGSSQAKSNGGGQAKHVIYLFMSGAMTHLDTFDLKPGREVQGDTKPIATNVSGMRIGDQLPLLAKQTDKMAIIRSMYTETGAHEPGRYLMKTSYKQIATTRHPAMGAWAQKMLGRSNRTLPDNVIIGGGARHPAQGFLEPEYSPLPIGDPDAGLQNTTQPDYLTDKLFSKRMELIDKFDKQFRTKYPQQQVKAYNEFYDQATQLLKSEEIKAFDLNNEKAEVREKYGLNKFGQGCLLARRLVQNNVRFIEVEYGSWDHHREIYDVFPERAAVLDQGMAALLEDLKSLGLLDQTLVVLATEFGRKPVINQNAGRDHHPGAFSCVLAGGGVRGGRFYGESDEDGHSAETDPVAPSDFNATIAHALGLPLDKEIFSPAGRPFKVADHGKAVTELF